LLAHAGCCCDHQIGCISQRIEAQADCSGPRVYHGKGCRDRDWTGVLHRCYENVVDIPVFDCVSCSVGRCCM
jgi:hypothetical protein